MSNLSKLLEGKLTINEFVDKSAKDVQKDLRFLKFIPGIETWLFESLEMLLVAKGLSPFLADMICDRIRLIVFGNAPPSTQQPPAQPPT